MDFTYDEQQTAFRKALRTFVDKEIIPVANEWEKTG